MSNKFYGFFERVEYIVDVRYDGNISAFSKDVGITRQYFNKMREQSQGKKEGSPNPSLDKILTIVQKSNVNPAWLLLGIGEPFNDQAVKRAFDAVDEVGLKLDDLNRSDIPLDERTEFVAKQLELLTKILRNPEKEDE